jgi:hypothetical protein
MASRHFLFHLVAFATCSSRPVFGNEGFKMTNPPWLLMKMQWKSEVGISPSESTSARRVRVIAVRSGTELLPRFRERILRVAAEEATH